ncbi:hypothetical protein N7466_006681 [Penicillium verhagenii]|uniref:uncharacterized protein n=1 Tax=Penicillium verhagenii TaxID=1562060 RepID=UPI00254535A9|nr:uncharacterized protein N7466_006681 [Penicillium verhagenii]KAJ5927725.1 hypothetical protein N7466_006681 [Penicillium verhagenii]
MTNIFQKGRRSLRFRLNHWHLYVAGTAPEIQPELLIKNPLLITRRGRPSEPSRAELQEFSQSQSLLTQEQPQETTLDIV